jgi:hypothetical protein
MNSTYLDGHVYTVNLNYRLTADERGNYYIGWLSVPESWWLWADTQDR